MSETYDQSRRRTSKTQQFSSLLLSDFAVMCSFILSHPLYFSYFIFFSPYLLKLLSFLSPLFITTTLLLLALLTLSPSLLHPQSTTDSKVCFLLSACHNVLEKLQTEAEDNDEVEDIRQFVELEAYRIVFDTSTFEVKENPGEEDLGVFEASRCNSEQDPVEITQSDISELVRDGDCLEESIKEISTECENITHNVEDKEVIKSITYSNKVEQQKEQPPPPPPPFMRSGSKAKGNRVSHLVSIINANNNGGEYTSKGSENSRKLSTDNGGEYTSKAVENSETLGGSGNLGNYGSMRKDKEWKRTLACKLFEERHNVDGGEGMDSLWETYETDPNKVQPKKNSNTKKGKKAGIDYNYENDEEEVDDAQLCCLQALKFSSGKMTLGMGKPNLMRFSKALKGLGWLHHVSSSSKHGKKGSN